jgi:hypothetical protein
MGRKEWTRIIVIYVAHPFRHNFSPYGFGNGLFINNGESC